MPIPFQFIEGFYYFQIGLCRSSGKLNTRKKSSKYKRHRLKQPPDRDVRNLPSASAVEELSKVPDQPMLRRAFWILLTFISILLTYESLQVGIPADEPIDAAYGEAALDFYRSFGRDTTFSGLQVYGQSFPLQKYYGTGFEMPVALIAKFLPFFNKYRVRHLAVTISGILIVLMAGLISIEMVGWLAGVTTLIFMMASPTFVGHMLFNSKDIPFTLGITVAIYFMIRLFRRWPAISKIDFLGFAFGTALATSIRIGGLITVLYFVVFLIIKVASNYKKGRKSTPMKKSGESVSFTWPAFASLGGIIAGLLFYPNIFNGFWDHVLQAMTVITDFPVRILMLFEGRMIYSTDLPRHFLIKSLIISLPLFIYLAIFSIFFNFRWLVKQTGISNLIFLMFTILFPLLYISWSEAAIYNGWRHVLFFYPSLIIVCSLSVSGFLMSTYSRAMKIATIFIFSVFILKVLIWQIRNYPYQYAYFNELAGGVKNAYKKYDGDYQQLAVTAGVEWLLKNDPSLVNKDRPKLIIASNNGHALNHFYDTSQLNVDFLYSGMKDLRNLDWDFAVMSEVFISPEVRRLALPPKDNIHTIEVDGMAVAYVIKRKNKADFQGLTALQQGDVGRGLQLLQQANQDDPNNFNTWLNLGLAYSMMGNGPEIIRYVTPYLQLYPTDWIGIYLLGIGYFYQKDYPNSEKYLLRARQLKPDDTNIRKRLIDLYQESGQLDKLRSIQQ